MMVNTAGFRAVSADALGVGDALVLPGSDDVAEVTAVAVEQDDFGTPALLVATVAGGRTVSIAFGSTVRVSGPSTSDAAPDAAPDAAVSDASLSDSVLPDPAPAATTPSAGAPTGVAFPPTPAPDVPPSLPAPAVAADRGSPEELVAQIAEAHAENPDVQELAGRLTRGINLKAGSNLQDLHQLALTLFIDEADIPAALTIADLLAEQPFDGNFGRWKWIEGGLAIAAYLTREDDARSAHYSAALRVSDDAETDPLRAKTAAVYRQRQLNEPNVYDPEILRASSAGKPDVERDWRVLRIGVLLYLRAHGGSETLSREVLERRIASELAAVAALNEELAGR